MVMLQRAPTVLRGTISTKGATSITHKSIYMVQHLEIVEQLVSNFGSNSQFETLRPKEIVEYAISNHDAGWLAVDPVMSLDDVTNLPRNLLFAPLDSSVKVAGPSADAGRTKHIYAELLISMHHTGLQQGRYNQGGGAIPALKAMAQERKSRAQKRISPFDETDDAVTTMETIEQNIATMLESEQSRQERIKSQLATSSDPETVSWVQDNALWSNYKAMQFIDTLALYFCLAADEERGAVDFGKVPMNWNEDITVKVERIETGTYTLDPYPFNQSPLVVTLPGTLVGPTITNSKSTTTQQAVEAGTPHVETITLLRK